MDAEVGGDEAEWSDRGRVFPVALLNSGCDLMERSLMLRSIKRTVKSKISMMISIYGARCQVYHGMIVASRAQDRQHTYLGFRVAKRISPFHHCSAGL
jgi:hypothetical protein